MILECLLLPFSGTKCDCTKLITESIELAQDEKVIEMAETNDWTVDTPASSVRGKLSQIEAKWPIWRKLAKVSKYVRRLQESLMRHAEAVRQFVSIVLYIAYHIGVMLRK